MAKKKRKTKTDKEVEQMQERRKVIQQEIHAAYKPFPNYPKIEELCKEMSDIDDFMYQRNIGIKS
jgi:hypothetical protein